MPASDSPTKFRWRRRLRWLAILSSVGAVLLLIGWEIENWRGRRVWDALVKEYADQGEPILLSEWQRLRAGVRVDERNFWATPLLRRLFEFNDPNYEQHHLELEALHLPAYTEDWRRRSPAQLDLVRWQKSFRDDPTFPHSAEPVSPAAEILIRAGKWDPELSELSQAFRRPEFRVPVLNPENWSGGGDTLPRLALHLSEIATARCAAQLELGDTGAAIENIENNEKLGQSLVSCGALGNHVGERILGNGVRMIYEGLARHRWDDRQLIHLCELLDMRDHRSAWVEAIGWQRLEMVTATLTWFDHPRQGVGELRQFGQILGSQAKLVSVRIGRLATGRESLTELGRVLHNASVAALEGLGDFVVAEAFAYTPGWRYQNIVHLVRDMDADLSDQLRWARGELPYDRKYVRVSYRFPPWWNVYRRWPGSPSGRPVTFSGAARGECLTRLALIAMVLERYRISHGVYPGTLADLVPGLLPQVPTDTLSGKDYLYARLEGGWYRLESSYHADAFERFMTRWPQPDQTNCWSGYAIGLEKISTGMRPDTGQ